MPVDLDRSPTDAAGPAEQLLRPAADTAAREQVRQAARQDRRGLAGLVSGVPERLRYLGSDEAARNGLRYQPVIWTVIAICAVAFFFPGRGGDVPGNADLAVASPTSTVPRPDQAEPTTSPTTSTPSTVVAAPEPPPPVAPAPAPTPPLADGAESPPPTVAAPPSTPPTTSPPEPLSVRGHGWAARLGAFPTASATVPDGTLPVATRLATTDKVSFVRLAGTETTLVLTEDPDGANEPLGDAMVELCVVEDAAWEEEPGQDLADAPPWSDTCTSGTEAADTWTFDLTGLGDPTSESGFALVPGDAAPAEFQVTFRVS